MKRIFAILLALLLLFSLVACSKDDEENEDPVDLTVTSNEQYYEAGGTYNDRFEYEIINGNEVAIIGFDSDYTPHEIVIPGTIESCPVVEISDAAFYQCSQITAVTVPSSVVKIGDMAFAGCVQLEEVKFAEGATTLKTLGDYVFAQCGKLTTITLPDSVTALGVGAFFQCAKLTAINIPEVVRGTDNEVVSGLTAINDMTFMGCTELVTVSGGEGVVTVGNYAFRGCAKLASISVPSTLTAVGDYAFSGCTSLPALTVGSGVTIGEYAFD